jgi:hypothetical protein
MCAECARHFGFPPSGEGSYEYQAAQSETGRTLLIRPETNRSRADVDAIDESHSSCDGADRLLGELLVIEATDFANELEFVGASINTELSKFSDRAIRQNSDGSFSDLLLVRFHDALAPVVCREGRCESTNHP